MAYGQSVDITEITGIADSRQSPLGNRSPHGLCGSLQVPLALEVSG